MSSNASDLERRLEIQVTAIRDTVAVWYGDAPEHRSLDSALASLRFRLDPEGTASAALLHAPFTLQDLTALLLREAVTTGRALTPSVLVRLVREVTGLTLNAADLDVIAATAGMAGGLARYAATDRLRAADPDDMADTALALCRVELALLLVLVGRTADEGRTVTAVLRDLEQALPMHRRTVGLALAEEERAA